jgi:hypothetical protein
VSFLSIAFLIALPLAAAPVLLHLFDRRRQVVIHWGAMQFLAEAASRKTSARKLKQWLLLLLRALAVAALALALARPMLPGSWLGGADRTETIFVIDNSMSMMRKAGDSSLFEQAIARAVEDSSSLPPGDFVRVLLASPYPVWATTGSVRVDGASPRFLEELRSLRPTEGQSDLLAALFTAVQTEVQPTQKERRIMLLTDGQRSDWSIDDDGGWRRFQKVLHAAPTPTYLEIIELDAAKDAGNLAISNIRSSRTVVGVNQPFRVTAHLQNHGDATSPSSTAVWSLGQEELHESQIPQLSPGAEHDVVWRHSFSKPGVNAVACRLDADDQLAADNQATVVVEVIEQAPLLVVESAADLAEVQQDSFFLQAALGWMDGEPLDEKAIYTPTMIEPDDLARADLMRYRAVVIPNYTDLTKDAVAQLEQFVADGGGLWIALGPRTDVEAFNQLLFADGAGLAPLAIEGIVDEATSSAPEDGEAKTTIDPFLPEHPATAELANHEQLDLGDVTVAQRFRFTPGARGEDASVLLNLNHGEPLAIEKYLGRGRVIVQAVPMRLTWSELVRSQSFVVMVHDWLDYLTQPTATRYNLKPGEPIDMRVAGANSPQATLRTPHGDEIELTADSEADGLMFRTSRTILPGNYWLDLGLSGDSIPFHVNRDPEESQLAPLTPEDHKLLAQATGPSDIAAATQVGASRSDPLWPLLLMVLIGLIAAELLLSGLIARERFGADPISETTEHFASPLAASALDDGTQTHFAGAVSREQETLTT